MKQSQASKAAQSKPIPVRLSLEEIARIESEAAAASMSRSGYIASVLRDRVPVPYPGIAVLAQVIAMRQSVLETKTISVEQIQQLTELVAVLSRIGSCEVPEL
ncbi:MAG TPA: hypothetical protein EYG46_08900 [Myxococcales bacterium]|nr:hypothetical protein [Myxococcales bacterium]